MSEIITTAHIIESLRQNLPPVFNRRTAQTALGDIINARTLANLDYLKQGPPKKYLGKTVVYERDSFLIWLSPRLSDCGKEGAKKNGHSHSGGGNAASV
jgi:hypothetical protein